MPFNSIRLWISKDTISTWYHSAKLSFNTQFTNGLRIQILKKQSQNPLPSLYFMGVGAENIDKEKRRVFYVSPFTLKTTSFRSTISRSRCFWCTKATYDANGIL
jgi:hypothetical protein